MKHLVKLLCVVITVCLLLPMIALGEVDTSERANLVFFVMGDAPKDEELVEAAINEILIEKFNATIDFQFSTWTDFQQKYANQLISGGVDMIYVANWLNYGVNAAAGAFLEMDDLLQYAPGIVALISEDTLNMCRVNGDLYAIPNAWPEYVPIGITYREDLRVKYDLPVPNSLENIEAYFKGVKDNEPNQPILRVTAEEAQGGFRIGFDAAEMLNIKYPWVDRNGLNYGLASNYETPSEVYDYWFSDDFVEDCKLLKRWADMGFWSKSALSDTNNSEAYRNGLCIAQVSGMNPQKQITANKDFATDGHEDWRSEYVAYGEVTNAIYPGHATQNATAIVRGSKYPERAMMVLDYFLTDETMNKLVQCGLEGTHYNIDADGLYEDIKDTRFTYENFNTWNLRNTEYKLMQKTDIELQAMFDKYAAQGATTKYPNVAIYGGFSEDYSDYQAERAALANVMRQYLAPLQAGLVDDVDAAVAEFRTKCTAAGIDVVRAGYTEQWLDYCAEYGYDK